MTYPASAAVETPLAPSLRAELRTLSPYYAVHFLASFAATLLTYCTYFMAQRELHATDTQRLWLSFGWGACYIPIALLSGYLTERWGPRRILVRMLAASIGTSLLCTLVLRYPSMWLLFVVLQGYNFTCSQCWAAMESAISRLPVRTSLSTRMSVYNISWSSSNFLAYLLADAVMALGWSAIFVVPAVIALASALILARLGTCHFVPHAPEEEPDLEAPADENVSVRARNLLYMAWVANALSYMAVNVLLPAMPTLTTASAGNYAAAGSAWGLARLVGFILCWVWAGWHYRVRYLIGMHVSLALAFFCLLFFRRLDVFLAAQLVFGFGAAFASASSLYYAMHTSSGHGGHAGLHEAFVGIGMTLGPAIGALAGTGGQSLPPVAFAVTSVLLVGTVPLLFLGRRAGPSRSPEVPHD